MNEHLKHIEVLATKALQSVKCEEPPVPVEEIAAKVGLEVVPFDFPDSFSGVLRKERAVIGINSKHFATRQRFTISHELGHFLLGHEGDVFDERLDEPIPLEREANMFASFLLMPKDLVRKAIDEMGVDLKALARHFDVSEQAITIRLLNLGFIK